MRQSGRPPQLPSHQPLPAPEAHPEVASSPPWQMSLPIHLRLRPWSPDPWRNDESPAWAPWVSSTTAVTGTDPEGWASTFIGLPGGGHTVEVVSPQTGRGPGQPPQRPRCSGRGRTRTRNTCPDSPSPPPSYPLPQVPQPLLTLSTSSFQSCGDHNRAGQRGREGGTSQQGTRGGEGKLYPRAGALPQLESLPSSHQQPSPLPPQPNQRLL